MFFGDELQRIKEKYRVRLPALENKTTLICS